MTIVRSIAKLVSSAVLGAAVLGVTSGAAYSQEQVNVRFSWKLKGEYAAMYVAQEKGYYAREGLNVRLGEAPARRLRWGRWCRVRKMSRRSPASLR